MSKGKVLSFPDAAREQAAPQRSHRGRTEHQAELKAISSLTSSWALPGAQQLFVLVWPPEVRLTFLSLRLQYPDVGTQGGPRSNLVKKKGE